MIDIQDSDATQWNQPAAATGKPQMLAPAPARKRKPTLLIAVILVACVAMAGVLFSRIDGNEQTPPVAQVAQPTVEQELVSSYPYMDGWERKNFADLPEAHKKSVFANSDASFSAYYTHPDHNVIMLTGTLASDEAAPSNTFIDGFIEKNIRPQHPAMTITPMDPVTISNALNPALNTAHLRMVRGSAFGTEEVIATIDGGSQLLVLIISAPNYDELMKAWPVFSDMLLHKITFDAPSAGSTSASTPPAP